jgi:hypothetical protein
LEIIPAQMDNALEILELQKRACQSQAELYDDYSLPPLVQTLDEIQEQFHDHMFLKAVEDGVIIGSVRAAVKEGTCHIGRLIVRPDQKPKEPETLQQTGIPSNSPGTTNRKDRTGLSPKTKSC